MTRRLSWVASEKVVNLSFTKQILTHYAIGGTAGSCVASQLARRATAPSVLLLEAGGLNENQLLAERYTTHTKQDMTSPYETLPQTSFKGRRLFYPRGRGLGGTSSVNFALYTIGSADDYDQWAAIVGDEHFNWQNTRRRYNNIESYNISESYSKYANPKAEDHGSVGPINVEFPQERNSSFIDVMDTILDDARLNLDINSGYPIGVGVVPFTARGRYRITGANFLTDSPVNLTVCTTARVTKIVFT